MADKKHDVQLQATRIDALMLPPNFSRAYQLYVLQQAADLEKIAGRANQAGQGAATAQEQNAQQDKQLEAHDEQISEQGEQLGALKSDAVSKSAKETQRLSSSLSAVSYQVQGVKVLGPRVRGFTAAKGSAFKGAFDVDKAYSIGAVYAQTEVTALVEALVESRRRIKALEDALRAHGIID